MQGDEYLAWVERLGREFRARGMASHRRSLAKAWPHLTEWRSAKVIEWLRLFRIPPYENHYPVLSPEQPCPKCHKREGVWTELVWPGGAKLRCSTCETAWICEHAPSR